VTTAKKLTVGDLEIAYSESGSGEPVILLHGGESACVQYDVFRPLLGDGIRAIAYDQRDTGESVNPATPYGMEDLARDCAALIRGLGYERAHVFGASFGGTIALQLAITVPEVVHTLTLGATVSRVSFSSDSVAGDIVELPPDQRTQKMLDFVLSPEGQASEELVAQTMAVLIHRSRDADARRLDAVRTFDVTSRLSEITAPTLLVYGEDDPAATPAKGREIAAAIPGARFEVIPKVRHGITLEGKEVLAGLLREFVLSHPILAGI
jgi:pimeloyl-ACP methyl ester carboxylesterase